MKINNILSIIAVAFAISQIIGCASPKLASTPLSPEEQEWESLVKSSYPSWSAPQTEPPVDINMTPGENPEAMMVGEKIVELEPPAKIEEPTIVTEEKTVVSEPAKTLEEKTYVVQKGDTLWKIADKFYGDGKKWEIIAKANKTTLTNPNKLKPGISIIIPPLK